MVKALTFFVLVLSFFSASASAHERHLFNPKNYVYDDEGNPLFVKIYVDSQKLEMFHAQKNGSANVTHFVNLNDAAGTYLIVPIHKKKRPDDDDSWTCPYCGTENPAYRNTCSNPSCVLYRKGGRDWYR